MSESGFVPKGAENFQVNNTVAEGMNKIVTKTREADNLQRKAQNEAAINKLNSVKQDINRTSAEGLAAYQKAQQESKQPARGSAY